MDLQEFGKKLDNYRDVAHGRSPASTVAAPSDLQRDCDRLLERLHQKLGRLTRFQMRKNQRGSLEVGKELLVEILDFVIENLGEHAVAGDLPRICELRDTVANLQSLNEGHFWRRVFRMSSSHDGLREQAFRQVGVDFIDMFRNLLSLIDGHLPTVAETNHWRSTCRRFITEFRNRW